MSGSNGDQVVPIVYGNAEHWLRRAREAREMAAQNYEIVAKRAEARDAQVDMPNYPGARSND
jgi:hypothetical protein